MPEQLALFDDATPARPPLPDGLLYQPDVLSPGEEQALLDGLRALPLREFAFHGYTGKRRTASFGWGYDFATESLHPAERLPAFLEQLRQVAAAVAGVAPEALPQLLVTEYAPGAGIGWHRDKAVFGVIVGVSLLAPCRFRLRRRAGDGWERAELVAAPRSAYVLRGASRTEWEHSIPPVDALRYSVTFRSLRTDAARGARPR